MSAVDLVAHIYFSRFFKLHHVCSRPEGQEGSEKREK